MCNCKLYIYQIPVFLTQPKPPKMHNFVTQPDQTRPNPTHGWTRSMSNSGSGFYGHEHFQYDTEPRSISLSLYSLFQCARATNESANLHARTYSGPYRDSGLTILTVQETKLVLCQASRNLVSIRDKEEHPRRTSSSATAISIRILQVN